MGKSLKVLGWLGLFFVLAFAASCKTTAPEIVPEAVSTIHWDPTYTPTATFTPAPPTATNTRVIAISTEAPGSTAASGSASTPAATVVAGAPVTGTITPSALPVAPATGTTAAEGTPPAPVTAVAAGSGWPTALPGQPPDPYQLIDRAQARGEIDVDHAAVYMIYALYADPGLPDRFTSTALIAGDPTGAYRYATRDWRQLNPVTQAMLNNYLAPRTPTKVPVIPPTATRAAVSQFPTGLYATSLSAQDNVKGSPALAGDWLLDLTKPGQATLSLNGMIVLTRSFKPENNQTTVGDLFGSYACNAAGRAGIYNWSFDGKSLTFKRVDEICNVRAKLLETHPWVKQP